MKEVFLRVLVISLTCSVILAPLLVFSKRLRGRYAGKTLYFLWLLLAIRMALPLPLMGREAPVTVELPAYDVTIPAMPPSAPAAPKAPTAHWSSGAYDFETAEPRVTVTVTETVELSELVAAVWAAGAGLFLLWQMVAYFIARRSILRQSCPATDDEWALLGRLCADLSMGKALNLCRSARVESPMLLGLWSPMVVLPDRESDPDELEAVLRHELCHLKRGDVAYKSFFLLVNALHWFNPLVWLMARAASRNVEFCCDDQVLRHADAPTKKHYGEVLLYTAAGSIYPAFSTHFGSGKEQLKERLLNLFLPKKNSAVLVCAVAAVALLAGGAVAFESGGSDMPFTLPLEESATPTETPMPMPTVTTTPRSVESAASTSDETIAGLLETICASPAHMSTPGAYIEEHREEYDTLLSYGGTTVDYCFRQFEQGGQTDLRGHIMAALCRELLGSAADVESRDGTGQGWYDAYMGKPETIRLPRETPAPLPTPNAPVNLPVEGTPEVTVEPLPPDTGNSKTVIELSSKGDTSLMKSASFKAEAGQTLTLTITSDISGGTVDLFLFSPAGKEQRVTIGGEDATKTIALTEGTWAYNCTGFFESGSVSMVGTVNK